MPVTRAFPTSDASPGLLGRIHQLLDEAFDDSFDDDWHHTLGGWHLLITVGDVVIAHASDVPRVLKVGDRLLRTGYVEAS